MITVNLLENVRMVSVFVWMDLLVMNVKKLFVQTTAVMFWVMVLVINHMADVFVQMVGLVHPAVSSK